MQPTKYVRCKACGHEFKLIGLHKCPSCEKKISFWDHTKDVEYIADPDGESGFGEPVNAESRPKVYSVNQDSLREGGDVQIKTLHAVRSIAIFILIMVTSSVISAVLYAIAIVKGQDGSGGEGFLVFGAIVALAGLTTALSKAWSEYSKSS